jgi:hypothetical protein
MEKNQNLEGGNPLEIAKPSMDATIEDLREVLN